MEDLNKTQTVLLCLLVSFVTSIGTGIITVSLLEEAPANVSQTINRVVERTVEKVVPQVSTNTVTKEVTVVVKEEDLVIDAINKNSKSLVRIYGQSDGVEQFAGIALVIAGNGTLLTDSSIISSNGTYKAKFYDGKSFDLKILEKSLKINAVYLTILKDSSPYEFFPVIATDSNNVQLGQTVIALGGKDSNQVSIGRISFMETAESSEGTTTKKVTFIESDTPARENIAGTLLLNLSGQVIGVQPHTPETVSVYRFLPINLFREDGKKYFENPKNNNP